MPVASGFLGVLDSTLAWSQAFLKIRYTTHVPVASVKSFKYNVPILVNTSESASLNSGRL